MFYDLMAKATVAQGQLRKRLEGQGMVEYVLIIALIAVACIAVMQVLGAQVGFKFDDVASVLNDTTHNTYDPTTPMPGAGA